MPTKWHRWTSMRVELLGCMKEQGKSPECIKDISCVSQSFYETFNA